MGGTGRHAQVAFFVLLGVILLISVVIAIYLIQQQRVQTHETPDQLYAGNPELAAEVGRMQQRVDDCLEGTADEVIADASQNGLDVTSLSEAEQVLTQEIATRFPDCFFQYNTGQKLTITDEKTPRVTVTLGDDKIRITAEYAVTGTYQEATYRLSSYKATITSGLKGMLETTFAVRQEIADSLRGETDSFISPDGFVNLYAFADQNRYLDLLINPDGTCTVYVTDYNKMIEQKLDHPERFSFTPDGPCIKEQAAQEPDGNIRVLDAGQVTCAASETACAIPFSSELPEGFMIISALDVDPLTWTLSASRYPPGTYLILGRGTDETGTTLQGIIVTIGGSA